MEQGGLSVCLSVGQAVINLSHAKTAEPIKMPCGLWTRVGPGNHALDGVQTRHVKGQFWGGKLSAQHMAG